jgi:hypothetical protein
MASCTSLLRIQAGRSPSQNTCLLRLTSNQIRNGLYHLVWKPAAERTTGFGS